jgi:hypothetical protein
VIPEAAVVLALFASPERIDYPLGPMRFPSMTSSDQRVVLTDVSYSASETTAVSQAVDVRLRFLNRFILGGHLDEGERGLTLETTRLDLAYSKAGDSVDLSGAFRARRFTLQADASRRTEGQGAGWVVDSSGSARLSPDLELLVGYLGETRPQTPRPIRERPIRRWSVGGLYQHDVDFDVGLDAWRARVRTEAGVDLDQDHVALTGNGLFATVQWDGQLGYEHDSGRFPRSEGFLTLSTLLPVGDHLFLQGSFGSSWEPGVARFEEETEGGFTFTARRVRLPRAGEAARLTRELARRAGELGYNERRFHDVDGRRTLRERLALSPQRAELADEIDALYRAQVEERNVLNFGLTVGHTFNTVRGTEGWTYRGFLGVPWPVAWPWRHDEAATTFLRLSYQHSEQRYEPGLVQIGRDAALEVDLNREMSVFFRWSRGGLGPGDIIRSTPRGRTISLQYVYSFGR